MCYDLTAQFRNKHLKVHCYKFFMMVIPTGTTV